MLPPGLAFAAVSDEAWEAAGKSDLPSYYLSFLKHRKSWEKDTTPWTPAITLFIGLARALEMMRDEGMESVWARHQSMGDATRAGVQALGLDLFPRVPANVQTVISLPDGLEYGKLSKRLFNTYGMKTAGGQDQLTGKILRIAHLGYLDDGDIIAGVSFLERALVDLGWRSDVGAGVTATQRVLAQSRGKA
jgi:aspartate aminotransferase-like enzyme